MERCAIFIDGAYLSKVLQQLHAPNGVRLDYSKLSNHLAQGANLLRAYYYDCLPYQSAQPTPEEAHRFAKKQAFFAAITALPRFEVREGKLERRGSGPNNYYFEQKRVDILLGVDMVELAATRQIQTAILVAGDSDFVPAIHAVKRQGVSTVLWHGPKVRGPGNTVHDELWQQFDIRHELTAQISASCV